MTAPRIHACVGPNGSGKDLATMVLAVAPALEAGRKVWSNIAIKGGEQIQTTADLAKLQGGLVVLSDIVSCFPSRGYGSMPFQMQLLINTLRHNRLELWWTGPDWKRADLMLREVTAQATLCKGMMGVPHRDPDTGEIDPDAWDDNRLFRWATYDVSLDPDFEAHTTRDRDAKGRQKMRPVRTKWYWRKKDGSGPQSLYDTLGEVAMLDHLDDAGSCVTCGGVKPKRKCFCDRPAPPVSTTPIRNAELGVTGSPAQLVEVSEAWASPTVGPGR